MTQTFDYPGVYIQEITGPSVITGVGTSTAAFIGPALRGPLGIARRISSFDEFIDLYGATRDGRPWPYLFVEGRAYFMALAVEGFFANGGRQAYIVRVGTAGQAAITLQNQANEAVFVVRARQDGQAADAITVETQLAGRQMAVQRSTPITGGQGTASIQVKAPTQFRSGDWVTRDGTDYKQITSIQGSTLTLNGPLGGAGNSLRLDDLRFPAARNTIRVERTAGLYPGGQALLAGDNGAAPGNSITERVLIRSVDEANGAVTIAAGGPTITAGQNTNNVTISAAGAFQAGDLVTTDGRNRARITAINPAGTTLTLSQALSGANVNDPMRLAGSPPSPSNRYNLDPVVAAPTLTPYRSVAHGQSGISSNRADTNAAGQPITIITVDLPQVFRPGDVITSNGVARARIERIQGNDLIMDGVLANIGNVLRIANIVPGQRTFRLADATGLYAGTVATLQGVDPGGNQVQGSAIVESVDGAGFVTLEAQPAVASTYNLDVADGAQPILIPQEFRLIVQAPTANGSATVERFEGLSLNRFHPRYVLNSGVVESALVTIQAPPVPPVASPSSPAKIVAATSLTGGKDDQPSMLSASDYQDALNILRDVDDVNMVCIPDAAGHDDWRSIQKAMIDHCLNTRDRIAILDSLLGAPPSGPGSVEEQRADVQAASGFAALYYPWLVLRDPTSQGARSRMLTIPPSGHIAGVYARSDAERGVHKAPANTDVRGVLTLERQLSDNQQGPLNLKGINVLRIFPGSGQVMVWGARTTGDPNVTDWIYVNVRRLMLYLEESIQESIRWAVFEPNNPDLWQKLRRTINAFLEQVWRDGALFGTTAEQAYRVRIDEALNPPSTRALGRLYIEIKVAPVRPAEFIVVRIGMWDGQADVTEL